MLADDDDEAGFGLEEPVPLRGGERHVGRREVIVAGKKIEDRLAAGGVDRFRHRAAGVRIDDHVVRAVEESDDGRDGVGLGRVAPAAADNRLVEQVRRIRREERAGCRAAHRDAGEVDVGRGDVVSLRLVPHKRARGHHGGRLAATDPAL